jgi:predicted nucleotide-binding protein (sugar kinase/HSP70/actin superfamily)
MSVDFTKQMKKEYTILAPDIFPTHMELLSAVFRMHGYRLEVLHYEGKQVIDAGLKYIHNDMCYPAVCVLGQQLYALSCGDYDPHKCALIQFQTGGGCRASNYIMLLRKALERMGMEYVPVISLNFQGMEHYSGFHITPLMVARGTPFARLRGSSAAAQESDIAV